MASGVFKNCLYFLPFIESIEEKTEKKKEESANSKNFNPELQQKMSMFIEMKKMFNSAESLFISDIFFLTFPLNSTIQFCITLITSTFTLYLSDFKAITSAKA